MRGIFFVWRRVLSRSCAQREGGHRRVNERAAETRTPHQSSKAENASHRGVSRERSLRPSAPVRRLNRDCVSEANTAARQPDRFRNSLYVNEEASYREASFVDCDGQFTSTGRTLSIAIVSPKTICQGQPQATNGVEKSLAVLRRAVNPRIARRPSGSINPTRPRPPGPVPSGRLASCSESAPQTDGECKRLAAPTAQILAGLALRHSSPPAGRLVGSVWLKKCPLLFLPRPLRLRP